MGLSKVLAAARYRLSPPTLNDGDYSSLQVDSTGNLRVAVSSTPAVADQKVQGDVADAGTDSGNPVKIGAVNHTTMPTYTDGQRGSLQIGTKGALQVEIRSTNGTVGAQVATATDGLAPGISSGPVALAIPHLHNGTNKDMQRSASALDTGLSTGVAVAHEALEDDNAGTFTSVVAKGEYRNRVVSATNTANVVVVDLRNLHDTLSIHMAASASTATLVVEASADNANWIQADSISAAQFLVKVYGPTTAGAAAAAAAAGPIAPLALRYVRITAGAAGVGNTTTLTIGAK